MKKIIRNAKFKLESAVIALGTLFITDPDKVHIIV